VTEPVLCPVLLSGRAAAVFFMKCWASAGGHRQRIEGRADVYEEGGAAGAAGVLERRG